MTEIKTRRRKREMRRDVSLRKSYTFFKNNSKVPVPEKDMHRVFDAFVDFINDLILDGDTVVLPNRMGELSIQGVQKAVRLDENGKPNRPPNWKKTFEMWKRNPKTKEERKIVYHLNEHTGGVLYKIRWSIRNIPVPNKLLYAFRPSRENKRKCHDRIMQGQEYLTKTL